VFWTAATVGCFTRNVGFARNIEGDRATLGPLINLLGLPGTVLSLVLAHAAAVVRANARLGLISPSDAEHVVSRHSADSLMFAVLRQPRPGERWLDVGSGAGFPGMALACCFPRSSFTLLEPLKRRAGFLELTAADLGLSNVTVDARRIEELPAMAFEVAVARALSSPDQALRAMIAKVVPGGAAIVAVGPDAAGTPDGAIVGVEVPGDVDSPGLFSMMTREG